MNRRHRKQEAVQELHHLRRQRSTKGNIPRGAKYVALAIMLFAAIRAGAQSSDSAPAQPQSPGNAAASNASAASTAAPATPKVVAWVNSTPIYLRDVEHSVAAQLGGTKLDPDQLAYLQATSLQKLIEETVLARYLENPALQPSPAEINAALDDIRKKLQDQKSSLKDYLDKNKKTETEFQDQLAHDLSLNKYVKQNTTDEALQAYFEEHRSLFDGTQCRASHIVWRPVGIFDAAAFKSLQGEVEQIRGRIIVGNISFEAAAEKYSAGPSRHNGGDVGYFPREGVMTEQFSEAAFGLKTGEISHAVPDSFGMHLIKVTDVKPGHKTWQDAGDALKNALAHSLLDKLVADQCKQAKIEFAESFPHFLPGTRQLASPQPVGTKE